MHETQQGRRQLMALAAVVCGSWGGLGAALPARAQGRQTPRLIVGSSAGGPADIQGRALAAAMREAGGPMTLVDNRPGAAGRLAAQALRQAAPDSTTLLLAPGWQLTLTPQTDPSPTVNPLTELQPVGGFCEQEIAIAIGPASRAQSLAEFVAEVRASGKPALCASGGVGSLGHLIGVMLERSAGIALQPVPYRGAAPALQDVQGGHVTAYAGALGDMVRMHREGLLRVLATSGTARSGFLPDVPSFKEAGHPEVHALDWTGVFAQKALPAATVAELSRLLKAAMADRSLLATLERLGVQARYIDPERLAERLRSDTEAMARHVRHYRLVAGR